MNAQTTGNAILARDVTPAAAVQISQVTAVEQARAVAEVQAAVVVAQERPRDMARAEAEMHDSCGRLALAHRAFYAVPNRGDGPSVHLARELARIWGNIDYGVRELRRDDAAGMSEIQAFAWDQQTNVRSTRTFQVPHERMAKGKRTKLVDLGDVYLNNQNIGARAVRECIFTVIPTWFIDDAQDRCRQTLDKGESGVPFSERVQAMVEGFRGIDVSLQQLEQRLGRKRGQWTADDVVQMGITYRSIRNGDLRKDDEFPPLRVTKAEVTGTASPGPDDGAGSPAATRSGSGAETGSTPADHTAPSSPPSYDDEAWKAGQSGKPKAGES